MMRSKTLLLIIISTLLVSDSTRSQFISMVHEILADYGLPKGLLPATASLNSFDDDNGELVVDIESNRCRVSHEEVNHETSADIIYKKTVRGKISPGKLEDVQGILLTDWAVVAEPVTQIISLLPDDEVISFELGDAYHSMYFPLEDLQEIPQCVVKESGALGEKRNHTSVAAA